MRNLALDEFLFEDFVLFRFRHFGLGGFLLLHRLGVLFEFLTIPFGERLGFRITLIDESDSHLIEGAQDLLELLGADGVVRERFVDLLVGQEPLLLALGHQGLHQRLRVLHLGLHVIRRTLDFRRTHILRLLRLHSLLRHNPDSTKEKL